VEPDISAALGAGEGRKQFFFEKKNQKTFIHQAEQ